jgi:hypothetical protein
MRDKPQFRLMRDMGRDGFTLYDTRAARLPGEHYGAMALLGHTDAQVLIDDMWSAGVRPTEGAGTAGSMAATQNHLEHVMRLLDTVLPKALR